MADDDWDPSNWIFSWYKGKHLMNEQDLRKLRAKCTQQRMLVTYMDDQEGQDIRKEDVVRPFNH